MAEQKTALTKQEKQRVKASRATRIMSEEEWAQVQEITYPELRQDSGVRSYLDEWEDKYKKL